MASDVAAVLKGKLDTIISKMAEKASLFVVDPDRDFTRNRTFTFEKTIKAILGMGGNSLQKELHDFFKDTDEFATKSAFVQQRNKILYGSFEYILHKFNECCDDDKTLDDYYIYACDGTTVNIAKNPNNKETYIDNDEHEGFNQYHINTLYDLMNRTYADAIIQGVRRMNEPQAVADMVDSLTLRGKTILMGDRGYGALNLIEHCNRKDGLDYVFRVKEDWITEVKDLPMTELDTDVSFQIRTTQTNEDKLLYASGKAKYMSGASKFGKYKKSQTWDFGSPFDMNIRIVRFILPGGKFETLATSLDRKKFPLSRLKELYARRWGIESSYRELKYAIGLINFHARKDDSIKQEIFASLIMYNLCERITAHAVVIQSVKNKHIYQVNFTMAVYVCLEYYRDKGTDPPDVLMEISRYIEPVRKGRADKRKMKPKSVVHFIYRVA
ncbi:MAG: IS4 family transposase [Oribacterium sp.]|nr:IS4 family transposase [Oribacterium sp.]